MPVTTAPANALPERLVAHRGYAARYPENTLAAVAAALQEGARYVEIDVQFSADRVPVLIHDAELQRATGHKGRVMDLSAEQLRQISAGEPGRFGDRFTGEHIPTLAELVQFLRGWPGVTAFIELKQESLIYFGIGPVVETVMQVLSPLLPQCVPISFDQAAMEHARQAGAARIGWCFGTWNETALGTARALAPDYLFCDYRKVPPPPEPLWQGPWQ